MYALISWTSRNGVTLEREEVEVRATRTLTVMNGGKMEPDATVNLQYRKDIWGGKIQSLHDSKNDAERHLEREVDDGSESPVVDICETSTNNAPRKRKKKSFGKDFEESTDPEDDIDESESPTCSPVLKQSNGSGKKSKQVPVPHSICTGKENRKRQKVSSAEKERNLNILSHHDELVISEILGPNPPTNNAHSTRSLAHPHFGGKQPKQHQPPKCISVVCREEKKILEDQLRDARQEVERIQMELEEAQAELRTLKAMQPSTSSVDSATYGKVPRSVGVAKNWEEISSGVWCCPIKVKAAVKDAATRTALACALLGIFYPKEELKGRRLHELDQDVVEAITDFCMVAKLTKEPPLKRTKEGDAPKPSSPMSRSTIKQAMRMKCNTIISLQRKKAETSNAS
ncbi:uncharacterized protein [Montipora capricornis]|uniref:uncharacterized protein n=2 Tax=Montipora TaxID=46703 RepID=UPI0035F113D2